MEDIVEPTISHDFSTLCLGPPTTVAGGSYFTRIMHKNNKPLYVQTPKCFSKQGFVKSGKRIYVDLMFDNNDTIFIDWIERLEAKCQELVYVKGEKWFQTKLEKDDIETAFTSPLKVYKSGKFYLLRVNVKPNIKIYNESDKVVNLEEIVETNSLISILEIQGIKFTSRNFQIEIDLKQSLVVSPDPFLDACFIKKPVRPVTVNNAETDKRILGILKGSSDLPENNVFDLEPISVAKVEPINNEPNNKVEPNNEISLSLEEFDFDEDFDAKTAANTVANTVVANTVVANTVVANTVVANTVVANTVANTVANISLDIEDLNVSPDASLSKKLESSLNTNFDANLTKKLSENLDSNFDTNFDANLDANFDATLDTNFNDSLSEFTIPFTNINDLETLTLKKPNQVYHEIYQKAREKAKAAKKAAMLAYLEVKNIKKTYMLDNMDDSDSESESDLEP
jgi:hypothetical protein